MKKQFFILLILSALLPSVIAFNCNSLSGGDFYVCNNIQSTSLTSYEKDLLVADIFNKNKTSPNFDFVYSWNTKLSIPGPSDGKYSSSGTIRNAWVDIVSLMPSIIENDTLYASDKGKLLTAFGYQSGSLPSGTEYRDCKTYYSWNGQSSSLSIYLNNVKIGSDKITAYQVYNNPENLNFRAELTVNSGYRVDHYRYQYYRRIYSCRPYSTDYRTDTLRVVDSLDAKLYQNTISSSFKITDQYLNITKGVLSVSNYTNLVLSFNNSEFSNQKYVYSLNYTLPYYALTIKAERVDNFEYNNIRVDKNKENFTFNVRDASKCKIELFDHFNSRIVDCDMSFNETIFSIKTDKTNYYENDTVKVYIYPSNVLVNVSYGNNSRIARNYTEFTATLYQNKVYAQLNDNKVDWLINVNKTENTIILYNLGALSFVGYFFYKSVKVYLLSFL